MIYFAPDTDKILSATLPFVQRDLNNLTQSKIGDVALLAKPTTEQVAYAGYRTNIEAFLYATVVKKTVLTSNEAFPVPRDYPINIPLNTPRTVIRIGKKLSAVKVGAVEKKLEPYELKKVDVGKEGLAYTLDRPSFDLIVNRLPQICSDGDP